MIAVVDRGWDVIVACCATSGPLSVDVAAVEEESSSFAAKAKAERQEAAAALARIRDQRNSAATDGEAEDSGL